MFECFTGILLDEARLNVYGFLEAKSQFTENMQPQSNNLVFNFFIKHKNTNWMMCVTSHNENVEENEVVEQAESKTALSSVSICASHHPNCST